MNLHRVELGDVDWIDLAQGKDRWRAVVDAVTNIRIQQIQQNAANLLAS